MEHFKIEGYLGKGYFGTVLKVSKKSQKDEKKYFALKILTDHFKYVSEADEGEQNILRKLNHPFIIKLIREFRFKNDCCMIFEYLSGGHLMHLISKNAGFSEDVAKFYLKEIIVAVEYLHANNIVHRDLKPNNILIDEKGHLKLADFGISTTVKRGTILTGRAGCVAFRAPEMLRNLPYGKEVDWWSVGLIFYMMLMGRHPCLINDSKILLQLYMKYEHFHGISENLSINAKSFLMELLYVEPKLRLGYSGVQAIKNHKFLRNVDWLRVIQKQEVAPFTQFEVNNNLTTQEKLNFINESPIGKQYKKYFGLEGFNSSSNLCCIS